MTMARPPYLIRKMTNWYLDPKRCWIVYAWGDTVNVWGLAYAPVAYFATGDEALGAFARGTLTRKTYRATHA